MADQTTANIRIVLEDASAEGSGADSTAGDSGATRRAGKATEEATRRPGDAKDNLSDQIQSIRKHHETTASENLRRNLKSTGRDWWQIGRAARGVLRGTAFAQQGTMASAGAAAYEFGAAGSSMAQFFSRGGGISAAIGSLGAAAGQAAALIGAFAVAVKASSDVMEGMAQRHRGYSADVAMAFANRNVDRIRFEMDQAARYGEDEARAVEARTKAGIEWDRMFDRIKSDFGGWSTYITERFGAFLRDFNEWRGLLEKQTEKDMDGMKMLGRVIEQLERFHGQPQPGIEWMKNTPHLELHHAEVNFQGFGMIEQQRVGGLNPFEGGL